MNLRTWLDQRGHGATAALARAVGTRWATIYEIANGHVPKAALAKEIEAATAGEVTAAELLGLVPTAQATETTAQDVRNPCTSEQAPRRSASANPPAKDHKSQLSNDAGPAGIPAQQETPSTPESQGFSSEDAA